MKYLFKQFVLSVLVLIDRFLSLFIKNTSASVLMYHAVDNSGWEFSVTPGEFQKQIRYLKQQGYRFLTAEGLANFIKEVQPAFGKHILITFDDAYKSVLDHALPVLEEFQVPAIVFVHTDRSNDKLRNSLPLLTWGDLSLLHQKGVAVQSHTHTHPNLKEISLEQLQVDLRLSEEACIREVGVRPTHLAYPGGKFNDQAIEELKRRGYHAGYTINRGLVRPGDDPFRIRRNGIGATTSWVEFLARISHAGSWYERIMTLWK